MIEALARDFRKGVVHEGRLRKALEDPYEAFALHEAVGVRPSVLQYELPLDDDFLRSVQRDAWRSKDAGKRVGREWLPRDARAVQTEEEAAQHWVGFEALRPWNDVCTKWCTRQYFPDAFSRVNMVANVIRLYDRLAEVTPLRFRIVFKGGVMIRLVLLEFLNNLPLAARAKAVAHLESEKALSISDFDFEIVPDNHDPSPDLIHRYFLTDYAVLLWLQHQMQREVARGYDPRRAGLLFLDWDEAKATEELKQYLQEATDALDATSPLHKARIDHVFIGDTVAKPPRGYRAQNGDAAPPPRRNNFIFDCDDTKCVMPAAKGFAEFGVRGVPTACGGARFYATLNTYIGEDAARQRPEHLRGLFHLARIKHAFVVYYTTKRGEKRCDRLGGEMVDLSQSHGPGRDELRAFLYAQVKAPYQTYPILGVKDVALHSYSVEGFLYDHMTMLYHTEEAPHNVNKAGKRAARYVAFFFAHVLGPHVPGTQAAKLRALGALARWTDDAPLRTGIPAVNAFAARARGTHRRHRAALRKHLAALHAAFASQSVATWDTSTILPVHAWHTDHLPVGKKIVY